MHGHVNVKFGGTLLMLLSEVCLVNKTNLVHNLFSVYLSVSTCFGPLCATLHFMTYAPVISNYPLVSEVSSVA